MAVELVPPTINRATISPGKGRTTRRAHRLSTADDDERLRGRYGRAPVPSGDGDAGAGLDVRGLAWPSGIFPVKEDIVGEIMLMMDADDERRET